MLLVDNKKVKKYIVYSAVLSLIFLTLPSVCYADVKEVVNAILGVIAGLVVGALGSVVSLIISGIVKIAPYNDFIKEESIKQAWSIIRDFSNMWFILILLLIAFATILRIETYNMKRMLPKLLVMAVLINFSRTICGIMIDFSQIIMLTFTSTFATTGGNFFDVAKITNMVDSINKAKVVVNVDNTTQVAPLGYDKIIVAYLLACVFMLVAVIAFLAILIVFVMRIIMLWVLVALSPLAFMLSAFPQGQKYASQYWGEFTRYLINGPVLAFFIWLSLSVMGNFESSTLFGKLTSSELQAGATSMLTTSVFVPFVMAIGFLVGGLMISQQIGGIGAGWGMGAARSLQNRGMNMGRRAVTGAVRRTGRAAADLGIGLAQRAGAQNALGAIGGSRGVVGGILAATGVRALATRGSIALGDRQHSLEEQAKRYVRSAGRDQRIANRIANGSELLAITPWQRERRNQMRNFATSEIGRNFGGAYNNAAIQDHMRNMGREDLAMWNDREVTAIGRSGAGLVGRAEMHVRNDANNLGNYNVGRDASGLAQVSYLDRSGNVPVNNMGVPIITYGNQPPLGDIATRNNLNRVTDPYRHQDVENDEYGNAKRVIFEVDKEELGGKEEKGLGNLSINAFARGQAQTMAVDFDKLGIEKMKKAGQNFSDIRGVNTKDRQEIADISKRMVDILGQEITKLKSKESMSRGDEEKVRHMENAQKRFMEPEKMEHLNLVNSGAMGMTSYRKLGETMVHEEIHGWGVDDENETEALAKKTMAESGKGSRSRTARKKIVGDYVKESGRSTMAGQAPVEHDEQEQGVAAAATSGPIEVIIAEDRSKNIKEEIKTAPADIRGIVSQLAKPGFDGNLFQFNFLLKQLNKTLLGQTGKLDKLNSNLLGLASFSKESGPLEMKIIQKQLQDASEPKENL